MTGSETSLTVLLRRFPSVYIEEGEMFAIKPPLAGYAEGKLPLSQACGDETQSGLTAMLRVYNNGIFKADQPSSTALAVRFNDGNHLFTTRNDARFIADLKRTPGWEIALRDSEISGRRAGVWCVPSQTKTLVQSTDFSGIPGDGLTGSWVQAKSHELSALTSNGTLSAPVNYTATLHLVSPSSNRSFSGGIGINSNKNNTFALTRSLGGYTEYVYGQGQSTVRTVFPKAPLQIDESWTAIKIDEETELVYAMSASSNSIKIQAYDPASNSYRWQYTLPAEYQHYRIEDSSLHLAGNYLVSYLQNYTSARDSFSGALLFQF